jgi:hypothetical protein
MATDGDEVQSKLRKIRQQNEDFVMSGEGVRRTATTGVGGEEGIRTLDTALDRITV